MRQLIRAAVTASAMLMAVAALAACGGSSSNSSASAAVSDQHHQEFVAGCAKGGPTSATCECIYQQLTTKQGLSTEGKLKQLLVQVQAASASGTLVVSALPKEFTAATTACKSGGGSGATQ